MKMILREAADGTGNQSFRSLSRTIQQLDFAPNAGDLSECAHPVAGEVMFDGQRIAVGVRLWSVEAHGDASSAQ